SRVPRDLHSFPTRRSSDLGGVVVLLAETTSDGALVAPALPLAHGFGGVAFHRSSGCHPSRTASATRPPGTSRTVTSLSSCFTFWERLPRAARPAGSGSPFGFWESRARYTRR